MPAANRIRHHACTTLRLRTPRDRDKGWQLLRWI